VNVHRRRFLSILAPHREFRPDKVPALIEVYKSMALGTQAKFVKRKKEYRRAVEEIRIRSMLESNPTSCNRR
jgi:hypothetical protein